MTDENLEEKAEYRKKRRKEIAEQKKRAADSPVTAGGHAKYPKGMTKQAQIRRMAELKAHFLSNNNVEGFVKKLFDIAMDDEHDGQMAAMKMVADRLLPAASYSSDGNKSSAVQINISGLQVGSIEEKPVDSSTVSIQWVS